MNKVSWWMLYFSKNPFSNANSTLSEAEEPIHRVIVATDMNAAVKIGEDLALLDKIIFRGATPRPDSYVDCFPKNERG